MNTPVKAIRAKCMDCCANQSNEVKCCPCTDCPLWFYRLGKRPDTLRKKKSPYIDPHLFENNSEKTSTTLIKEIEKKTADSVHNSENRGASK